MTERITLLITLELSIARGSVQRRTEMALQLTDLFVRGSTRFTEDQINLFDETITRLASEVDTSVLTTLAQRLAPLANAPINIIRKLANDHEIKIAYPILAHSERLDEGTLIRNAQTKSQKHLLAISWRKTLSEALTDVLLERGNRQTVLSTTKNPGARLSDAAFGLLVQRSHGDDVLAALLGSRTDILSLLARAPEAIRMKLVEENQHVKQEIDRVFAMIADHFHGHASTGPGNSGPLQSWQGDNAQFIDDSIPSFGVGKNDQDDGAAYEDVDQVPEAPSADSTQKEGRRRTVRQKSFLRGCVYFNNRRSSVECLIRDMSPMGARILISHSVNIPDTVDLYIPQKDQTLRAGVEWRRDNDIGLAFFNAGVAPSEKVPSNELTQRVSQLESEIASLRGVIKRVKSKSKSSRNSDAA